MYDDCFVWRDLTNFSGVISDIATSFSYVLSDALGVDLECGIVEWGKKKTPPAFIVLIEGSAIDLDMWVVFCCEYICWMHCK